MIPHYEKSCFPKPNCHVTKYLFATNSQKYGSFIYNAMFEIHYNHKIIASVSSLQ
jgi:hypothetical protein